MAQPLRRAPQRVPGPTPRNSPLGPPRKASFCAKLAPGW
eukprot:CAMPEP_0170067306 /NCGR_PEP_ID=MMETSP0019_2-20121128/6706_1 /TAXON_ID=98059 /ORGANISM="Dinobryon sp., Strain UTEXLB2267" /LENGTH=38 /DNA_ID= /DNA_START= /DNA_END= /DNA_ORIENTATION=